MDEIGRLTHSGLAFQATRRAGGKCCSSTSKSQHSQVLVAIVLKFTDLSTVSKPHQHMRLPALMVLFSSGSIGTWSIAPHEKAASVDGAVVT